MKLLAGVVIGLLIVALAALAVAWSGVIDMSATAPSTALERVVGTTLADRSIHRRAPRARNPLEATPEVLRTGLDHYRENCVVCHGAPGVAAGEAAKGLNPPAPDLSLADAQEPSDGELFEVIGHGIRMSGMPGWLPTHTEREIWAIVAFMRHLPSLTPEERRALARGGEAEEEHAAHHGGEAPAAGGDSPRP